MSKNAKRYEPKKKGWYSVKNKANRHLRAQIQDDCGKKLGEAGITFFGHQLLLAKTKAYLPRHQIFSLVRKKSNRVEIERKIDCTFIQVIGKKYIYLLKIY